jgi:HEAT repeat protein
MTMPIRVLDKRLVVAVSIVAICAVVAAIMFLSGEPDVTVGTPEQRVEAVVRLASERSSGAKNALLAATRDASPKVRRTALVGLSHMLDDEKVRPAIEKAIKDEDAGVRAIGAEALGQFNDGPATGELIGLLENESESESVRKAALRGLVNCDDSRAIVAMIELASRRDAPLEVRRQSLKSALRKAHGRLLPGRDPTNDRLWRDLIQRFKNDQRVRRAYAEAGVELVDHPEDIVTR